MPSPADAFTAMAERIGRIDPSEFAGAVVVVPPGEAEPIAFLTTDPEPNAAQFFSAVMSRVEIGAATVREQETAASPYGRR